MYYLSLTREVIKIIIGQNDRSAYCQIALSRDDIILRNDYDFFCPQLIGFGPLTCSATSEFVSV